MKPKTFGRWCEDNGRRSVGCADYAEFARNAADYEVYRAERAVTFEAGAEAFHAVKGADDLEAVSLISLHELSEKIRRAATDGWPEDNGGNDGTS